ncbi:hypothetical protein SNE40_023139 [Patella caerulea]|uniref:Uncharacterized protein n=1 Tax=Patella caerulea TaxID=87958 RepID=A0AAN8FXY9_PATCE
MAGLDGRTVTPVLVRKCFAIVYAVTIMLCVSVIIWGSFHMPKSQKHVQTYVIISTSFGLLCSSVTFITRCYIIYRQEGTEYRFVYILLKPEYIILLAVFIAGTPNDVSSNTE